MTYLSTELPACRADLVIRPIGEAGRYVVKLPGTHDYFHLGEEEHFLLTQLDGERDAATVCTAFATKFAEALTDDDLDGFLEMARGQKLLENAERGTRNAERKSEDNATATVSMNCPTVSASLPVPTIHRWPGWQTRRAAFTACNFIPRLPTPSRASAS